MKLRNHGRPGNMLALLALLATAGTVAVAEVPDAPANVCHTGWRADQWGNRTVEVYWANNGEAPNADGYYIYQSIDGGACSRVAIDDVFGSPWGGYAFIPVMTSGEYTYCIAAYKADGESGPGPEASVSMN